MRLRFSGRHALVAAAIFVAELLIALFVHDRLIRPLMGDVLVVPLLYFFARTFVAAPPTHLALAVFGFACGIECLQWLGAAQWLGLQKGSILYVTLGATFDWLDIVAYAVGALLCVLLQKIRFLKERLPCYPRPFG